MYRPNGKSILATPHFVALRAIAPDEELIFDYGFNEINDNSVNSYSNSQDIQQKFQIILHLYLKLLLLIKRQKFVHLTLFHVNDINWLLEYHPLIEISCLVMI